MHDFDCPVECECGHDVCSSPGGEVGCPHVKSANPQSQAPHLESEHESESLSQPPVYYHTKTKTQNSQPPVYYHTKTKTENSSKLIQFTPLKLGTKFGPHIPHGTLLAKYYGRTVSLNLRGVK